MTRGAAFFLITGNEVTTTVGRIFAVAYVISKEMSSSLHAPAAFAAPKRTNLGA